MFFATRDRKTSDGIAGRNVDQLKPLTTNHAAIERAAGDWRAAGLLVSLLNVETLYMLYRHLCSIRLISLSYSTKCPRSESMCIKFGSAKLQFLTKLFFCIPTPSTKYTKCAKLTQICVPKQFTMCKIQTCNFSLEMRHTTFTRMKIECLN